MGAGPRAVGRTPVRHWGQGWVLDWGRALGLAAGCPKDPMRHRGWGRVPGWGRVLGLGAATRPRGGAKSSELSRAGVCSPRRWPRHGAGAAFRDPPAPGSRRLLSRGAAGRGRVRAPGGSTALPRWALGTFGRAVGWAPKPRFSGPPGLRGLPATGARTRLRHRAPQLRRGGRPTAAGAGSAARWPVLPHLFLPVLSVLGGPIPGRGLASVQFVEATLSLDTAGL